jgi:hypothetical protein
MKNPKLWYNFEHNLPENLIQGILKIQHLETLKYIHYNHLNNLLSYYFIIFMDIKYYLQKIEK